MRKAHSQDCTDCGYPLVKVPGAAGLTTITKPLATREDLFPRTAYPGSLHDCLWEGCYGQVS